MAAQVNTHLSHYTPTDRSATTLIVFRPRFQGLTCIDAGRNSNGEEDQGTLCRAFRAGRLLLISAKL
jgi:hypothetical protein